jgi:hypothetical protein
VRKRTTEDQTRVVYISCSAVILVPAPVTDSSISTVENHRAQQAEAETQMGGKNDGRSFDNPTHDLGPQALAMCRKIDRKRARGKEGCLQNVGLAPREPSPGELSNARSRGAKQSFLRLWRRLVGSSGDRQARREAGLAVVYHIYTVRSCSAVFAVRTRSPVRWAHQKSSSLSSRLPSRPMGLLETPSKAQRGQSRSPECPMTWVCYGIQVTPG